MSNNYHTQLNQQSGILNEIASTLQFDQRPGTTNFDPDSKTRSTVPRFDNVEKQRQQFDNVEKRQYDDPKTWNNYGHIQGTPINNERTEQNTKPRESKDLNQTKQDEIQLSDIEQHNISRPPTTFSPQEQQCATNLRAPLREKHSSPKTKENFVQVPEKTTTKLPESTPIKKYAIEYALIPLSLAGVFILLVHPTTSVYLEKYIPKMTDLKGVAIRGAILAIIYIVIKMIISQTIEKN